MHNATACSVHGCDQPTKRAGYCYSHYMKQWRYGTPTPEHAARHEDLTGRRFGTLTVVQREGRLWLCRCDCGRVRSCRTGDLNRTADRSTCGHKPAHRAQHVGYSGAHMRIRTDQGPASQYACVDCGRRAHHWSYDHADPNEQHEDGLSAHPIAYSLDQAHYVPRCVPCHKAHDLEHIDSTTALAFVSA